MTSKKFDKDLQKIINDINEGHRGRSHATLYDGPHLEEIDPKEVTKILEKEGIPECIGKRLHAGRLEIAEGHYVLCIAWHGPYRGTKEEKEALNKGKEGVKRLKGYTNDDKKDLLNRLLRVMHQLLKKHSCEAFFIGGDFNLVWSLADDVIEEEEITGVSNGGKAVDYMIIWPSTIISNIRVEAVSYAEFNHPVVFISVELYLCEGGIATCRENKQNRRRDDDDSKRDDDSKADTEGNKQEQAEESTQMSENDSKRDDDSKGNTEGNKQEQAEESTQPSENSQDSNTTSANQKATGNVPKDNCNLVVMVAWNAGPESESDDDDDADDLPPTERPAASTSKKATPKPVEVMERSQQKPKAAAAALSGFVAFLLG